MPANSIKISEIFESLQGEGRFAGEPMLFIRVSGCTQSCAFCDTKYHTEGKEYLLQEVVDIIKKYRGNIVCFTGGEPLLYKEQIRSIILSTQKIFHLETNAELLDGDLRTLSLFSYVAASPKSKKVAFDIAHFFDYAKSTYGKDTGVYDIKIVTDGLTIGMDMIKYATMLMPLTTGDMEKDKETQQRVWNLCIEKGLRYSPRIHVDVWGFKCRKK